MRCSDSELISVGPGLISVEPGLISVGPGLISVGPELISVGRGRGRIESVFLFDAAAARVPSALARRLCVEQVSLSP